MSVGSVSNVSQASSLAPAARFQWLQMLKAVDVRIVALAVGLVCVLALAIRWWRSSAQLPAAPPQQRSSSSLAVSSAAPSATSAPSSAVSASDQQIVAAVTAIEAELKTFVGQNRDNVTCKIAPTTAMIGHYGKKGGKIISLAQAGHFDTAGEKAFSEKWSDLSGKLPEWLKQFGGQKITFLVLAENSGHNDNAKAKVVECDFSSVPAPQPVTSSSAVVASSITAVASVSVPTSDEECIRKATQEIIELANETFGYARQADWKYHFQGTHVHVGTLVVEMVDETKPKVVQSVVVWSGSCDDQAGPEHQPQSVLCLNSDNLLTRETENYKGSTPFEAFKHILESKIADRLRCWQKEKDTIRVRTWVCGDRTPDLKKRKPGEKTLTLRASAASGSAASISLSSATVSSTSKPMIATTSMAAAVSANAAVISSASTQSTTTANEKSKIDAAVEQIIAECMKQCEITDLASRTDVGGVVILFEWEENSRKRSDNVQRGDLKEKVTQFLQERSQIMDVLTVKITFTFGRQEKGRKLFVLNLK